MRLNDNHTALERIKEKLINRGTDFSLRPVDKITVTGSASPEGNIRFIRQLSVNRSRKIFDYPTRICTITCFPSYVSLNYVSGTNRHQSFLHMPYRHLLAQVFRSPLWASCRYGQPTLTRHPVKKLFIWD